MFGGNHGDEYEGQLAASTLARSLQPDEVSGRVIIVPCLSGEASRASTRRWLNGDNLNRAFPGVEDGTPAEKIAYFITNELFPRTDAVIDMHSGGRSMFSLPVSHMHWEDDSALREPMVKHMLAWNTGHHFIYGGIGGSGNRLLPGEAARQGKIVVTTELGGGGFTTVETMRIANEGLANVLRSIGSLRGDVTPPSTPPIVLDARDPACYPEAHRRGLFENAVRPGQTVVAGQAVGYLHDMDDLSVAPEPVVTEVGGVVIMIRALPIVEPGDVVSTVGGAIELSEIY